MIRTYRVSVTVPELTQKEMDDLQGDLGRGPDPYPATVDTTSALIDTLVEEVFADTIADLFVGNGHRPLTFAIQREG